MSLQMLFEKFDQVVDRPESTKEIRDLILQLAVQGKLVPQEPNDEPASVLLERIRAEKEKLVKEGKIKREKPLPPIDTDEAPFEAPVGWQFIRFSELLDFQGGSQPPKSHFSDLPKSDYVQLIQIRDLGPKPQPIFVPRYLVSKFCTNKDIMIGRYGASVGKVFWGKNGAYNVALIKLLNQFNAFSRKYLFNLMKSPIGQNLFVGITRSAQSGFSKNDVAESVLPLPPIAEQHRIVEKVDRLMVLCDDLEDQLSQFGTVKIDLAESAVHHLMEAPTKQEFNRHWTFIRNRFDILFDNPENVKKLKQAILQLAVQGKLVSQDPNDEPASVLLERIKAEKEKLIKEGKIKKEKPLSPIDANEVPFKAPAGWEWARIKSIAYSLDYGTSKKSGLDSSMVPVYRMGNIDGGKLSDSNLKYISPDIDDLPRLYLRENDILFNRTNSYELVGKSALYLEKSDRATFASYLIRISLVDAQKISAFVDMAMRSAYFRSSQIEPSITKQCGQANFNGTKLAHTLIPLPPLVEQHRIVNKVDRLMGLCDQLESDSNTMNQANFDLLQSLVHHAIENESI
jgi:type I restriction enzyme, S subunit